MVTATIFKMSEGQEIRIDSVNGEEFLADEVSVSHSPVRFVIDFKAITPRMDIANHPPRTVIRHNVVLLDPYFAKELLQVLTDNLSKYEKKFGTVKRPEVLAKYEAEMTKQGVKAGKVNAKKEDYFG